MQKNVVSQKVIVYAFDSTTNLPKTGDAANLTAYVSKDYGSVTVLGDTSATEMDSTNAKGYYLFDLTQAETNGDTLLFSCKSSTPNIVVIAVPAVVFTTPANFNLHVIDGAGLGDANVVKIGPSGAGVTTTANLGTNLKQIYDTDYAIIYDATNKAFLSKLGNFAMGGSSLALTIGAISCTTLTASGAVAFQSTFAVTGTTTFNAFTVTNAMTVSGTTTHTGAVACNGGVTFSGVAASGATPATAGLTITGGAASTTGGGVAGIGLSITGGAEAATGNGAAVGVKITAGASTVNVGADGMDVTGTNGSSGLVLTSGANGGSGLVAITGAGTAYAALGVSSTGEGLTVQGSSGFAGASFTGGTRGNGITITGGNAVTTTAAGVGLSVKGGNASTSAGGTAGAALKATGGAGAASTNGAGDGAVFIGGGTTTVSGGNGLTLTHTGSVYDFNATTTPLTLAKTTNITGLNDIAASAVVTGGAITTSGGAVSNVTLAATVTTLTNLPAITASWLTATGIAADAITATKIADGAIDSATFASGTTIPRCTLVDTLTTYTGNTVQTGDAYAQTNSGTFGLAAIKGYVDDIGVAGAGLTALGDTRIANLDTNVGSRMATYAQPTGFLAATFPSGTVASTTNITAGTITTVTTTVTATNLTNAPTSGDFTATMKTSLNSATPAVTVSDKTGFSLAAGSFVTATFGTCDLTSTMKTSVTTACTASTPVAASVSGAVGSVTGNVGGNVVGTVASVVGAVGSVTSAVIVSGTSPLTESYTTGSFTLAQALYEIAQLLGEVSLSGTTLTMKKRDASTAAGTWALNSATTPRSRTRAT